LGFPIFLFLFLCFCFFYLPARRLKIVLLLSVQVFAPGNNVGGHFLCILVRVIHHLAVRRLVVFRTEEGNGECDFRVRSPQLILQQSQVARLDKDTRIHVIPPRMLLQQQVEFPRLVFRVVVERLSLVKVRDGFHQFPLLRPVQDARRADMTRAARAAREIVGSPFGIAIPAGDDRMVDSLIGLGLLGGHHGHVGSDADLGDCGGLDVLDGLHFCFALLFFAMHGCYYVSTTVRSFLLAHFQFQFLLSI
jgi:hypothetical protein